jgi:SAM-dependent methyltransferase
MSAHAQYDFEYEEGSVYARVASLVAEHAGREGVHLDLGCGYGAIAEKVREQGLTYVGLDVDERSLAALRDRGFQTAVADLQDVPAAMAAVDEVVGERPIASISLLDTLEHVTTGSELLAGLHARATESGAPLVVSVPNVAHHDIAIKLLTGRFDYTSTGLLDSTHVVLHTEEYLANLMVSAGWREIAENDLPLEWSDQHFPADHAALADASVLHRFLVDVRKQADDHGSTNQFIRAYLPGRAEARALLVDPEPSGDGPFLTVVVRTQGRRLGTLRDALLCLAAQTSDDFEVVVTVHRATPDERAAVDDVLAELPSAVLDRTRPLVVEAGGRARPLNDAVLAANGRYLAVLDDDDLVFAHWVETFAALATTAPGNVLRAVCVEQQIEPAEWSGGGDGVRTTTGLLASYPSHFDLMAHIGRNHTPFMSYAFPMSLFRDLGLRFDESLDICEDWDLELRAALLVGVASTPEVTAVYRRWVGGSSSASLHDEDQWRRTESAILARIDAVPHVFPAGTITAIREATLHGQHRAEQEILALVERNRELEEQARGMEQSTSWRVTAPLRKVMNRRRPGG